MPAVPPTPAHPDVGCMAARGAPGQVRCGRPSCKTGTSPGLGTASSELRCGCLALQAGTTAGAGVRRCGRMSQGPGGWAAAGWLQQRVAWKAQQTLEIQLEQRVVHGCDEGIVAGARRKRKCAVVPTKWLAHDLLQTQHRVRAWAKVRAGAQLSSRRGLAREQPALAQAVHAGRAAGLGCVPRDSRRPGCARGRRRAASARPPPHSAAGGAGVGSTGGAGVGSLGRRRAAGRRVAPDHTGTWLACKAVPCKYSGLRLSLVLTVPAPAQTAGSPGGLLAWRHLSCTGPERPVGAACR